MLDNYAYSSKGGIWIIWDPQVIECEGLDMDEWYIHFKINL